MVYSRPDLGICIGVYKINIHQGCSKDLPLMWLNHGYIGKEV